ncbi:unnamed protein product [Arctogadus glacialis]
MIRRSSLSKSQHWGVGVRWRRSNVCASRPVEDTFPSVLCYAVEGPCNFGAKVPLIHDERNPAQTQPPGPGRVRPEKEKGARFPWLLRLHRRGVPHRAEGSDFRNLPPDTRRPWTAPTECCWSKSRASPIRVFGTGKRPRGPSDEWWRWGSLLSCVAFGYGCENLSKYEEQGLGIQWSNIAQSPEEGTRYSFLVSILMMLLDALLYWTLTCYIENVFPGQYGIPKPWYFLVTRSYWCGTTAAASAVHPDTLKNPGVQNGYLEKSPPDMKAGVSIQNLVKIYKTGKKLAVDGLSVDFYENHITSFLGHNGAGKTTTMSILTGLFPPTSGTALIHGLDIHTDMDAIRKHLGMCPQHNVLFNDLTVEEHVYFYARLKGLSRAEVAAEMDQMIADVGLPHKRKDLSKNLSGGMQRKLSVAIAFVGGSKIVILDEPTAGVDPYARRGIWELLLKYKQGRTIILSTHHMDEADILGDRIAIISHGKMRCCGSSMFLKKVFGRGYYLTLVRGGNQHATAQRGQQPHAAEEKEARSGSSSSDEGIGSQTWINSDPSDVAAVGVLVRRHVPGAVYLESIGQEVTFILPYAGAKDGSFATLFKDLDLEMGTLGLTSYGISDTTLEEIFLKVAEDTGVDVETQEKDEQNNSNGNGAIRRDSDLKGHTTNKVEDPKMAGVPDGKGSAVVGGSELIRRQFLALFLKRFHHARRSRKGLIAQAYLPPLRPSASLSPDKRPSSTGVQFSAHNCSLWAGIMAQWRRLSHSTTKDTHNGSPAGNSNRGDPPPPSNKLTRADGENGASCRRRTPPSPAKIHSFWHSDTV